MGIRNRFPIKRYKDHYTNFCKWTQWSRLFWVTYMGYAALYGTRKPLSVVKTQVSREIGIGIVTLGGIDCAFLSAYATGQLIFSRLWTTCSPQTLLLCCYLLSAGCAVLFVSGSSPQIMCIAWLLNGLAHASVFPILVAIVASTTSVHPLNRGRFLIWTTSQQIGAIITTLIASYVTETLNWRAAILIPALLCALAGLLLYIFLVFYNDVIRTENSSSTDRKISSSNQFANRRTMKLDSNINTEKKDIMKRMKWKKHGYTRLSTFPSNGCINCRQSETSIIGIKDFGSQTFKDVHSKKKRNYDMKCERINKFLPLNDASFCTILELEMTQMIHSSGKYFSENDSFTHTFCCSYSNLNEGGNVVGTNNDNGMNNLRLHNKINPSINLMCEDVIISCKKESMRNAFNRLTVGRKANKNKKKKKTFFNYYLKPRDFPMILMNKPNDDRHNRRRQIYTKLYVSNDGDIREYRYMDILLIPNLISCALAYFFVKMIRYSLLSWLPYFLVESLQYDTWIAGYSSMLFDMGGIVGSIATGHISDRLMNGRQIMTAACMCLACGFSLFILSIVTFYSMHSTFLIMSSISLVGFSIAGPDSILGAVAAQELCEQERCNISALTIATGLINGVGSIGAVMQGYVTAAVSQAYGWSVLFFLLSVFSMSSLFLLLYTVVHTKGIVTNSEMTMVGKQNVEEEKEEDKDEEVDKDEEENENDDYEIEKEDEDEDNDVHKNEKGNEEVDENEEEDEERYKDAENAK